MKRKHLTETTVCPQERLVIISYTTGLSFALERIGPLAAIIITIFYLLTLYLFALPNTPENLFASIYSESLIKTTCQHLLLLVGFDTLIYRKYYDTPLYLWVISVDHRVLAVWSISRFVLARAPLRVFLGWYFLDHWRIWRMIWGSAPNCFSRCSPCYIHVMHVCDGV
jgi:predicted membrane protein